MSEPVPECERARLLLAEWREFERRVIVLTNRVALQGSNVRDRLIDQLSSIETAVFFLMNRVEHTDASPRQPDWAFDEVSDDEYATAMTNLRSHRKRIEDVNVLVANAPVNTLIELIARNETRW